MIDVLRYILKNHVSNSLEIKSSFSTLGAELLELGLAPEAIETVLDWLRATIDYPTHELFVEGSSKHTRLYNDLEIAKISHEARGLIYLLEFCGIVSPAIRELVIDRAMAVDQHAIDYKDMRCILSLSMLNKTARQHILALIDRVKTKATAPSVAIH